MIQPNPVNGGGERHLERASNRPEFSNHRNVTEVNDVVTYRCSSILSEVFMASDGEEDPN